jgi:hypothetical protein
VQSLLDAGWQAVRVVTDHGWLLMPGGLPKVDLPKHLASTKWSRCALLQGATPAGVELVHWHWNAQYTVATPPGVACFTSGQEYAHGGVSIVDDVAGNDAADDSQFHLLQPMFSSSLAHSLPQRQLRNAETQRRRGHHRSLPHRQLRKPRQKTSLCQLLTPASSWHQRAFSPSPNDGLSPPWIAPKEKCLLQTGPLP